MKIKVLIHEAEEGGYWAEVPAMKGCFTQAETYPELLENLYEAIQLWVEVASEGGGEGSGEASQVLELAV